MSRSILYRGLQWDKVTAGVIAWDVPGRRVADRLLAVGTTTGANLDLAQPIRITLCAGGVSFVVWVVGLPLFIELRRVFAWVHFVVWLAIPGLPIT